jgi:hypothetical protein
LDRLHFGRCKRAHLKIDESVLTKIPPRKMPVVGVRLHNRQRLDGIRRQTIQPHKDQAIHGTESQSLRQVPLLDVKLMTKDQDFGFQRDPRPEQQYQHRPDQAVSFSHDEEALRDSASRTSGIWFPTGTPSRRTSK